MSAKRKSPLEKDVERLIELRRDGSPAAVEGIRAFVLDPRSYLVAKAADAAIELEARELEKDLAVAFKRLVSGEQEDPGCNALSKVAQALGKLEADEAELYRSGLKLIRRERSGTDFIDTAVPVRIECAHALVTVRGPEALLDVTPMLADEEPAVRAGAARALGRIGTEGAAAVLHLKLLIGDRESEVIGACFGGLLEAAHDRFVGVVARYLQEPDERLVELAALALGECHSAEGVAALQGALSNRRVGSATEAILIALALSRRDDAAEQLFKVLETGAEALAVQAVTALAVLRHRPGVEERIREVVRRRRSAKLSAAVSAKLS